MPTGRDGQGASVVRVFTPEEYIARSEPYMLEQGFHEREIARRTERFGAIAHSPPRTKPATACRTPSPSSAASTAFSFFMTAPAGGSSASTGRLRLPTRRSRKTIYAHADMTAPHTNVRLHPQRVSRLPARVRWVSAIPGQDHRRSRNRHNRRDREEAHDTGDPRGLARFGSGARRSPQYNSNRSERRRRGGSIELQEKRGPQEAE